MMEPKSDTEIKIWVPDSSSTALISGTSEMYKWYNGLHISTVIRPSHICRGTSQSRVTRCSSLNRVKVILNFIEASQSQAWFVPVRMDSKLLPSYFELLVWSLNHFESNKIDTLPIFFNFTYEMAEMNGFRFFKSWSNLTISFRNPIQIR